MIDKLISHYKILEKLGEGGMGVVYKARDTKLGRPVALKFLPHHLTASPQDKARFLQEAKIASALNHPNVCVIYDIREHGDQQFIVMEYVDGVTLREKIAGSKRGSGLHVEEAISFAIQIGDALQEAHSNGIVHRDVKAENIMVNTKNQVKVMDFGLARLKGSLKLTRSSSTVGTLAYMAPEQIQGGEVDARSDIFSFGVVLYEMLTARMPFRGEHEAAVLYSIIHEEPEPVQTHLPEVSPGLIHVLSRALEKDPENRYPTIHEMLVDLRRLKDEPTGLTRNSPAVPSAASSAGKTGTTSGASRVFAHGGDATTRGKAKVRRMVPVISVSAVVALTAGVLLTLFKADEREQIADHKMLVVLPFENLGSSEEEFFADGITDEITARLASVQGLAVIARTSAMQYKNTDKSHRQIGEELGVDYILEGTVRWQNVADGPKRVRVTPQLIKVADATQLWAKVYDQVLREVFEVQSAIAEQVTNALDIALSERERQSLNARATSNLEAYDYYLRGNDYFYRGNTKENCTIAIHMYQNAVDLDPDFAMAYGKLAQVQTAMYWFYYDRAEERLRSAKQSADMALRIRADLPEAHLALGWYYYQGKLDYARALEHFAVVTESQPNNSEALHGTAAAQRRQGNWDQALMNFEKAAKLDPRSRYMAQDLGETYWLMRKFPAADRYLGRAVSLAPDWYVPQWYRVWLYLNWQGTTTQAWEVVRKTSGDDVNLRALAVVLQSFDGNYKAALDGLPSVPEEFFDDQFRYRPVSLAYAGIYGLMGERQLEQAYYDSARIILESKVNDDPNDPRYHIALGIAYAGLGRKEEAVREGRKATEMLPVSREAWRGTVLLQDLAHIHVMVGDYDSAISQIEHLLSMPSELSVPLLRLDPTWAPLLANSRFQKILKRGT